MERKRLVAAQFRIQHPDQHNWDLEEFRKGGKKITKGPNSGKLSGDKWVNRGHFSSLRRALLGWFQEEIALGIGEGDAKALLTALDAAEMRVLASLTQVMPLEVALAVPEK